MHRTTLLLPLRLWRDVQRYAEEAGCSANQFIREAVLARIYFELGQGGETPFVKALKKAKNDLRD